MQSADESADGHPHLGRTNITEIISDSDLMIVQKALISPLRVCVGAIAELILFLLHFLQQSHYRGKLQTHTKTDGVPKVICSCHINAGF